LEAQQLHAFLVDVFPVFQGKFVSLDKVGQVVADFVKFFLVS
jgi:hypothetical protein